MLLHPVLPLHSMHHTHHTHACKAPMPTASLKIPQGVPEQAWLCRVWAVVRVAVVLYMR